MSAVDLDHALRSASVMYADDSSVEHFGYYSCLSSLAAVEVARGLTSGVASLTFTLDSGASSCFFRDCTDLTPLQRDPWLLAAPLPSCVRRLPLTLHLDVWGPSSVLGPRQERYFLIVVDEYSRCTTVFTLRRKADVPTVLEPWLLARGGAQGLCGLRLHLDRGGEFSSTRLETFCQGRGIILSYTLPNLPQQNGVAERRIGMVMEVARTSMCHASAPLVPVASVSLPHRTLAELWPSDTRPRVMPVSFWTGSPGVAADFRVWGSLAHVRALGANKLSPRTRACVFLGSPLDASGWVFYDPVTYKFFASQDVTFDEFVCYYRSCPRRGTEVFSPPLFLTLEPPPVAPVAPPPSRPNPSGVSHVTPQSSPPQRPVPIVSGGAGGAVTEGEGTVAAGASGVGSGGVGGVGVEVTPVEDTAASSQRPRPASPPCFLSVPQFPPRSSLRPIAAEPGGVPAGGTGGPVGVGGGGAGSGGTGAGGTSTVAPTPRTVLAAAVAEGAGAISVAAAGESRGGVTAAAGESRVGVTTSAAGAVAAEAGESRGGFTSAAAGVGAVVAGERRGGVTAAPGVARAGFPPAAAGAVKDIAGESRGVTAAAGEGSAGVPVPTASKATAAAGGAIGVAVGAGTVAADARGGGAAWTRRSPLGRAVSPEPRRSRYCADGPFHLVLRSCVPPPPVLPQPPVSSLTVLHDPLSDYLCASHPVVSRVLSLLVTHPTAPLSSVSALLTILTGFASSYRLDYASHLVSGTTCSPSTGGVPVFPQEVLEDRQFELGFLAAAVPHLCAMLLAPEGDPDAIDIPISRTHVGAISGP
ncbi:unnamed protein product [Closterium sp. NIES-53]